MLDNLFTRAVAALESIADSLEILAGGDNVKVDGVVPEAPVVETTVAQAKEKKPRGKKAAPVVEAAPEQTAPAPEAEAPAPAHQQLFAGSSSAEPAEQLMTLEQCNTVLVNSVNSGAPTSQVMDILSEYSPQQNLRFIEAIHYAEIARRVSALV